VANSWRSRVLLSLRDLQGSLRFYEETLGLAVYRESGRGRKRGVIFLGGGLLEASGSSVGPAPGAIRLFLHVSDLRAVHQRLAAQGVPVEQEPTVQP
jgi:catechol 2,3-dioxygenase-like lactoylglutathione lyase family enzyme